MSMIRQIANKVQGGMTPTSPARVAVAGIFVSGEVDRQFGF
jgi:hypothetical protein